MNCPAQSAAPPKRVQLPRSSTRTQIPDVYCKLLTEVTPPSAAFGPCRFEGTLYRPGAVIESLPTPAVVVECCGPQGIWRRGKHRPYLYRLWTLSGSEWIELARAEAFDASWTAILAEPARQALHPRPELVDILALGRTIADELVEAIDGRLQKEIGEVRSLALSSIYERMAGRIVDCL